MINARLLKYLAFLTMTIDHVGYLFFDELIILRIIGRLAFVLFAFLIVEGYQKTTSFNKYILRLFILAVISEPIFDLMTSKELIDFSSQNVVWIFILGLLSINIYKIIGLKTSDKFLQQILNLYAVAFITTIALILRIEYALIGIMLINYLYVFKSHKIAVITIVSILAYLIGMTIQVYMLLVIPFIILYNEEKIKTSKWWYLFYPVHMLILIIIERII